MTVHCALLYDDLKICVSYTLYAESIFDTPDLIPWKIQFHVPLDMKLLLHKCGSRMDQVLKRGWIKDGGNGDVKCNSQDLRDNLNLQEFAALVKALRLLIL